jgi:DNA primase
MTRGFSPELSEALEKFEMSDYLDMEGVDYKRTTGTRGEQLNVKCCPKCGGSHWKVYLNAETGLGNCFSGDCEMKYNKFLFVKEQSGLSGKTLGEYIKQIAVDYGWMPKKRKAVDVDIKKTELIIPASIALPIDGQNLIYLEDRGIKSDVAKYFNLRFCEVGDFKFTLPDGGVGKQRYDNRVVIPIYNMDGKLVSFQGRDILGTAEKKYLFPPGHSATGAHLFNGQNAVDTKRVIVCEGVFDVAAVKIAMDEETTLTDVVPIGTFGKNISSGNDDSQIAKFITLRERGIKEVTFMWDGEKQALKDAIKYGTFVKGLGFTVRIAILPAGKDPNEVTTDVVRQAFYKAVTLTPISAIKLAMHKF